ncbi:MAG TPA: LLM class F420-dependent oxidoreductase [Candidatus Binataceae bacterium]|nr:LLM class F420-dependent oxidoreductase [Candidatus Binataceae bacterium]
MKIGVFSLAPGMARGTALTKAFASHAERLGFSTLWVPEHVVLLDKYASKYPYSENGVLPAPTNAPIPDPFISLTVMASATEKIRLATGICLVPEHNPVVLAKVIATLDWLSEGRVALGVGIGWLEEEFTAIGIPWERRAQRTRECIAAMRKLWGDELSSYQGEFVSFKDVRSYPKPVQGARLPIIFGGESTPALRRVADYGTGWFGFNLLPDEASAKIAKLDQLVRANNRKLSDIELIVSPSGKQITPDDLKRYRDAGVSEVVITTIGLPRTPDAAAKMLEEGARKWLEPASKL